MTIVSGPGGACRPVHSHDGYPREGDLFVTEIAVRAEVRRQGIARALTMRQIENARCAGARHVLVTCWEAGPSAHLFTSVGFQPIARVARYYADGSDMVYMALRLATDPSSSS